MTASPQTQLDVSSSTPITSKVLSILSELQLDVREHVQTQRTPAQYGPIPGELHSDVYSLLKERYPDGLYSHQSDAMSAFLDDEDVCLSTSTASGKSLVFMASALSLVLNDSSKRVLAMYPVKALVRDQYMAWKALCDAVGCTVELIDGSVKPKAERLKRMKRAHIWIMTPDVVHAWAMRDQRAHSLLRSIGLLILDEAHVYNGAFGANMACFLRRLQAFAPKTQIISSTATLSNPASFIQDLTGRDTTTFLEPDNGAPRRQRDVFLLAPPPSDSIGTVTDLLSKLCTLNSHQFLAFADSRKSVELLCQIVRRSHSEDDTEPETDDDETLSHNVYPFRSGYDVQDRLDIQTGLQNGSLRGVISTSALELGIDIGSLDIVVCTDIPWSQAALHQRLGRAGRHEDSVCILFDTEDTLSNQNLSLRQYLDLPAEENRLYLDNPFILFTQALCAADESEGYANCDHTQDIFQAFSPEFLSYFNGEHNDTYLPEDLQNLRSKTAGIGPHTTFSLRSSCEDSYDIVFTRSSTTGASIQYSQLLREAYPGAIYRHLARSYRIQSVHGREHKVRAVHTRQGVSTTPETSTRISLNRDPNTWAQLTHNEHFALFSTNVQVQHHVFGFTETHGKTTTKHLYASGSNYAQRPISRYLPTHGLCWTLQGINAQKANEFSHALALASATVLSINKGDLGAGAWSSVSISPHLPSVGGCIFDNLNGGLRLSSQIPANLERILSFLIKQDHQPHIIDIAQNLLHATTQHSILSTPHTPPQGFTPNPLHPDIQLKEHECVIFADNTEVWLQVANITCERARITRSRFRRDGSLTYHITTQRSSEQHCKQQVSSDQLQPIAGVTSYAIFDDIMGQQRPV